MATVTMDTQMASEPSSMGLRSLGLEGDRAQLARRDIAQSIGACGIHQDLLRAARSRFVDGGNRLDTMDGVERLGPHEDAFAHRVAKFGEETTEPFFVARIHPVRGGNHWLGLRGL